MSKRLLIYIVFILLSTFLAVTFVRLLIPEPDTNTVTYEEKLVGSGLYKSLGQIYLDSLRQNPHSVTLHQKMQVIYPTVEESFKKSIDDFYDSIATYYTFENEYLYAIGFRFSKEGYHDSAAFYYSQIQTDTLPYLQHSLGYANMQLQNYEDAELYFNKAIENGSNAEGAYGNLAKLYHLTGAYDKLDTLISNDEYAQYIPYNIHRIHYVKSGKIKKYLGSFLAVNFSGFIWEGVVASLLIALVWMGFLFRISLFKRLSLVATLTFFIFGALFSTFCTLLYDFYDIGLGITITGDHLKDLLFCILGIGLIEESLKILPVLLYFICIRKKKFEPMDLLIYGTLSAVGFAFMENMGYFDLYGLKSIFGRSLTASVLHMGLTALPIYGIIRAEKDGRNNALFSFLFYFSVAVVIHGAYDFFLFADKGLSDFKIVSILIWGILLFLYRNMIQNLLNISSFYDLSKEKRFKGTGYYLGYMLYAVFLIQFVFISLNFGSDVSVIALPGSIAFYSYLLLLIPIIFGTMHLHKGYFPPLIMLGKRVKAPIVDNPKVKATLMKQWLQFKSEHHHFTFRSTKWQSVQLKDLRLILLLFTLTVTATYTAFVTGLSFLLGVFSLISLLGTVYCLRTLIKRITWHIEIDIASEELLLYKQGRLFHRILFSEVQQVHTYGRYRELILHKKSVLCDRTLFQNMEVTTFFLYFESYLLSKEEELEEFAVFDSVELELPEFQVALD